MAVVCVAGAMLMAGCEGGDSGGDETAISGSSQLRVINDSDYSTTTYFDGDYIGEVGKNSSRTWNVPTGSHTVRFDNADVSADAITRTYSFQSGREWIVTVTWENVGPF
jgi:hypothetical protein